MVTRRRFAPRITAALLLCFALSGPLAAQKFYTYVGDLGTDFVLIAWGTTTGANTIGRSSKPHGNAVLRVGDHEVAISDRNYAVVRGLTPDHDYPYQLALNGRKIAEAKLRTWPLQSNKLCFFVIGDYGSGDQLQAGVAAAMTSEFEKHATGDCPIRFVITTGDNIYGRLSYLLRFNRTGSEDRDYESKFYVPYQAILAQIPFHPSLGNHDGNETENRADLTTYLDNFFFPGAQAARYYRFSYGGLADFFALDSTTNTEKGPPAPAYLEGGDQYRWAVKNFEESKVPWKIPYFHNPPFNAGPRHPSASGDLGHFLKLFEKSGVKVAFSGHEHNFQFTKRNAATGGIRYIVSGAGGELRTGDIRPAMEGAQVEGWAAHLHFLSVEIEGKEMKVMPVSFEPVNVVDRYGKSIGMPLKISIP